MPNGLKAFSKWSLREISLPEAGFNSTSHELKQDANGCVCVLLLTTVGKKQQRAKLA
jgi:hypothetical protein